MKSYINGNRIDGVCVNGIKASGLAKNGSVFYKKPTYEVTPLNANLEARYYPDENYVRVVGEGDLSRTRWIAFKDEMKAKNPNPTIEFIGDDKKIKFPPSSAQLFRDYDGQIIFNRAIDTSEVISMGYLFYNCKNFNSPLTDWDTSKVTNLGGVFMNCENFNQPVNHLNTSSAIVMNNLFRGCKKFNQPVDSWDTSKVVNMYCIFYFCEEFNQPLNSWDVSKNTSFHYAFYMAKKFNQPLNEWNTSSVEKFSGMFCGAVSFNQNIDYFNYSKAKSVVAMLQNAHSLEYVNITDLGGNQNITANHTTFILKNLKRLYFHGLSTFEFTARNKCRINNMTTGESGVYESGSKTQMIANNEYEITKI